MANIMHAIMFALTAHKVNYLLTRA